MKKAIRIHDLTHTTELTRGQLTAVGGAYANVIFAGGKKDCSSDCKDFHGENSSWQAVEV